MLHIEALYSKNKYTLKKNNTKQTIFNNEKFYIESKNLHLKASLNNGEIVIIIYKDLTLLSQKLHLRDKDEISNFTFTSFIKKNGYASFIGQDYENLLVIYNKNSHKLILYSSYSGQSHFFYHLKLQQIHISSSYNTIVNNSLFREKVNEIKIIEQLVMMSNSNMTFFNNLFFFNNGDKVCFNNDSIKHERNEIKASKTIHYKNIDDYREHFFQYLIR